MKCQILFSGKNKKKVINLSSAELAQRVVKMYDTKSGLSESGEVKFLGVCHKIKYLFHPFSFTSSVPFKL